MADHRVEGVHGPVAEQSGDAGHSAPEQRRHDRVGRVLGDRLDGRPRDAVHVQAGRVAADQVGHLLAGRVEVAAGQVAVDQPGLAPQRSAAEHRPGRDRGRRRSARQRRAQGHRAADTHGGERSSTGATVGVDASFQPAGRAAEERDGVAAARIRHDRVERGTEQQPGGE
ncbi:MAG TPA: hypothetical protein VH373_00530 [Jatrophihabitantaceae bacterium]